MEDRFGREIDYLRVSVTDHCNFRCVYCMPEDGMPWIPKENLLTQAEMVRLIRIASEIGMRKIRLTGGEPLLVTWLPDLIGEIRAIPAIREISVTTNGYLMQPLAAKLKAAGLDRANISLDTLRPDRFRQAARRGSFDSVWKGIEAAFEHGLEPVKLNVVAMKGFNDDEAADFAALTIQRPIHIRFIELMPIRWNRDDTNFFDPLLKTGEAVQVNVKKGGELSRKELSERFISSKALRGLIEAVRGPMEPAEVKTNGPSKSFRIPGALGTVGFISQISNDMCSTCNRLRLTPDGFLRPCLMSDGEVDFRSVMREGASDAELAEMIRSVIRGKPERHYLAEGQQVVARSMSQIGG